MNFLEAVNEVLVRLRERPVASVNENSYSQLIGALVNDTKREVENAWDWHSLLSSVLVNASKGIYSYALPGIQKNFRVLDVINDTADIELRPASSKHMNRMMLFGVQEGIPRFYNQNGYDGQGNPIFDIAPVPDKTYDIYFNIWNPQPALKSDADVILAPADVIVLGAWARAANERGEDGGVASGDLFTMYRQALGEAISFEANRFPDKIQWTSE